MRSATPFASSGTMSATTTCAPCAAMPSAPACPMPEPPPTTSATRPERSNSREKSNDFAGFIGPSRVADALLAGILHIGKLLELGVVELSVDSFDAADIDRLNDVARLRVDHDRSARAVDAHPF